MKQVAGPIARVLGAAVGVALGLLFGIPATGASLTAIDVGSGMAGDGSRHVAYTRANGVSAVLDAKKGNVKVIRGTAGCRPVDVGAGRVLFDCSGEFEEFRPARLASVKGGTSHRVRGSTATVDFREVGRFWLRGEAVCPAACSTEIYLNRRTGAKRTFSAGDAITNRHPLLSSRDLDLNRKRLRFRPHPSFTQSISSARSLVAFNRRVYVSDGQGLRVWRSATESRRIGSSIGACCGNARGLRLGSGRITWIKGRNLLAFDLKSHRKYRIHLARSPARATPVKQGAVVAVPVGDSKAGRYKIRVIRLDSAARL